MKPSKDDLSLDPMKSPFEGTGLAGPGGLAGPVAPPPAYNVNDHIATNLQSASDALAKTGGMSQSDIIARSMEGVDQSGRLPNAQNMTQQATHLGGDIDTGMQTAIQNRQNKLYGSHLNEIQSAARMNAPLIEAKQQAQGMAGMASLEDIKTQMVNTQLVKMQNDQAQRNAILNSVLGLVGAGVGAAIPKLGAAAGSQIATGVGKLFQPGGGNTSVQALDSGGQNSSRYFGGR